MILDYLFLPILLFICLITSYQDFRNGKIKNKWIILGIIWGLGVWILLLGWSQLVPYVSHYFEMPMGYIKPSYILEAAINSSISFAVGYLLWHFNLWSAGDAKLFFVVSLLLPLKYYMNSAVPYFPSAVLLINIFSFALVFLALKSLFIIIKSFVKVPGIILPKEGIIQQSKKYIKANYKTLIKTTLIFVSILFIFLIVRIKVRVSFNIAKINSWYLVIIFILLSKTSKYVRKIFKKVWLLIILYLILIPYLLISKFFSSAENLSSLYRTIKNSLLFGLAFSLLYLLLTAAKKKEKETHMPFAFWIFVGTIITILIEGSVFSLFLRPNF
jgi:hypothetical protein